MKRRSAWPFAILVVFLGPLGLTIYFIINRMWKLLIAYIAIISIGLFVYHYLTDDFYESGLPKCDTATARSSVDSALAQSPLGISGVRIIRYLDAKEIMRTDNSIQCAGHIWINTDPDQSHDITYTFTKESDGNIYVKFRYE